MWVTIQFCVKMLSWPQSVSLEGPLPLTWMNDIIRRLETAPTHPPTRNYQMNQRCGCSAPQFHQLLTLTVILLVKGSRLCNRSHHTPRPVIGRLAPSSKKTRRGLDKKQTLKIAKSLKPAILKDGDSFNGFNSRRACVIARVWRASAWKRRD